MRKEAVAPDDFLLLRLTAEMPQKKEYAPGLIALVWYQSAFSAIEACE